MKFSLGPPYFYFSISYIAIAFPYYITDYPGQNTGGKLTIASSSLPSSAFVRTGG
jgi:hypothetical protein